MIIFIFEIKLDLNAVAIERDENEIEFESPDAVIKIDPDEPIVDTGQDEKVFACNLNRHALELLVVRTHFE